MPGVTSAPMIDNGHGSLGRCTAELKIIKTKETAADGAPHHSLHSSTTSLNHAI